MSIKPLIALVGRPNVGKSTLFNRIVGRRLAVVSDVAGTTRDRKYADAEWNDAIFTLVDTGGIELIEGWHSAPLSEDSEHFLPAIRSQAAIAIQDADVIIMVVDALAGITAADQEVANILRRSKKPILIAANKLESSKRQDNAFEFYELGLGEVLAISALHGPGVADLLDVLVETLPPSDAEEEEDETVKIALLGRPNVGKSTLLNKLLGEERSIVSPIAGTTRDSIDTIFRYHGEDYTLIDTAGIRRRGKINVGVEKYSVLRSIKALARADIALVLIDATEGVTAQDMHIAGMVRDESKAGVIVLINKWDLVEKDDFTIYDYAEKVREQLNFMPYVPFLFISAETGQRVHKVMEMVVNVNESRYVRINTGELNRVVRTAVARHAPPGQMSRLKFYYVTQAAVAPPVFIFFVNYPELVHFTYRRYLENQLREQYAFTGTPIRLVFRARSEERFGK
ncbi:MAG TPA: ribosome biogenesis GTPase Der [Anaerolineae bacterium]|nr:ribosome biogenesis GTPase Der [Anaerolineae bacterium]